MRSILLHIADDSGLEARLQVALDLVRAVDGHLTCLQARPLPMIVPGDFGGASYADMIMVQRQTCAKERERIEQRLASEDVAWSWVEEDGMAAERLIARGAIADLIVVGCRDPWSTSPSELAGDLVLHARSPILIVPDAAQGIDPSGAALVAWDGSQEAAGALRAAVPLLSRARSVVLAMVREEKETAELLPSLDGAEYLSRHGIPSEIVELPRQNDTSIARVLARAAAAREAAYMVMGGYGHMRMLEAIFGGVTRELFADPPLPIFACR